MLRCVLEKPQSMVRLTCLSLLICEITVLLRNRLAATRDGTSMNQFIAIAVAEKLAVLNAEQFFAERREQGDTLLFRELLTRSGGEPVRDGDELPN